MDAATIAGNVDRAGKETVSLRSGKVIPLTNSGRARRVIEPATCKPTSRLAAEVHAGFRRPAPGRDPVRAALQKKDGPQKRSTDCSSKRSAFDGVVADLRANAKFPREASERLINELISWRSDASETFAPAAA